MGSRRRSALLLMAATVCLSACRSRKSEQAAEPPWTSFAADFELESSLARLEFSDPAAWRWSEAEGATSLELVGGGEYRPPYRSPLCIALFPELVVGSFAMEVELLQTGREYGHRDLCLFFGYRSPERFYYVHLASAPDDRAHNIFLVDGADRRSLAPVAAEGVDWGQDQWHRVRLERDLEDGSVRVYFDGGAEPILEVIDRTLGRGRIGLGSFDDSGRFAHLRIFSPDMQRELPAGSLFE